MREGTRVRVDTDRRLQDPKSNCSGQGKLSHAHYHNLLLIRDHFCEPPLILAQSPMMRPNLVISNPCISSLIPLLASLNPSLPPTYRILNYHVTSGIIEIKRLDLIDGLRCTISASDQQLCVAYRPLFLLSHYFYKKKEKRGHKHRRKEMKRG